MIDQAVDPNDIYDATQQLAYMHWKVNIISVSPYRQCIPSTHFQPVL